MKLPDSGALHRECSGTGKSSLARNVSDFLGWRYYEKVITSRTQARDLLWEVAMLHDDKMAHNLSFD